MYVIHLIILLNILGVMIDNKRFVFVLAFSNVRWQQISVFLCTILTDSRFMFSGEYNVNGQYIYVSNKHIQ